MAVVKPLDELFPSLVDAGHRAVIFDRFRGVQDVVVGEGTHFLIPWVQKPIIFDCRSRPRNIPVITGSKGECLDPKTATEPDALMGFFISSGCGDLMCPKSSLTQSLERFSLNFLFQNSLKDPSVL